MTLVLQQYPSLAQTSVSGQILSADGSRIPAVDISVEPLTENDLFKSTDGNHPVSGEDGSYRILFEEPGLYEIGIRGVFHRTMNIPILVYDQPEIKMNILMQPKRFDNGEYFENQEYLEWIRVTGNFNDDDFQTGRPFYLNADGSVSAYIPVTSDTLRYQVRGLASGLTAFPLADEYRLREDRTFESLLYTDLPEDSLEIRYEPGETVSFPFYVPKGINPLQIILSGYLSFERENDAHWVFPIIRIRSYHQILYKTDWEQSAGLTEEEQYRHLGMRQNAGQLSGGIFNEMLKNTTESLDNPDLNPQQHTLLYLAYAGILQRDHMMYRMEMGFGMQTEEAPEKPDYDPGIIHALPGQVSPAHPAWSMNPRLPHFLLELTDYEPEYVRYFSEMAKHHPDNDVAENAAFVLLRNAAGKYGSVEEVPVYRIILERFGEGRLARRAHLVFEELSGG